MGAPRPRYTVDPSDPRAPAQAVWDGLPPEERAALLSSLPTSPPLSEASPPEGDAHFGELVRARDVLRRFFGGQGRGVYVGNNLPVYYPEERMFAPDVLVVLDVDPHDRDRWSVSAEGKGLDLVLEVSWSGSRAKDLKQHVERLARLGVREYFVFDRKKLLLQGWRLPPGASGPSGDTATYARILPRGLALGSEVLGLELGVEGTHLRFFAQGGAPLPETGELVERLTVAVQAAVDLAAQEAERARTLESEVEQLRAELERLREGKPS